MKTSAQTKHFSLEGNIMELNLTAPKSWKELSAKHLTYISYLMTNGQITPAELHAFAFVRFTGIRVLKEIDGGWICKYKKHRFELNPEQVTSFCRQLSWLTDNISEIVPIPELAGRKHSESRLRGCPLKQYLACENYYQAYIFTKEEKYLNCLIAAFYTNGKAFNDGKTLAESKCFEKLPFHIRNTVFLWYYGLKSVLQKNFPHFLQKVETILEDEEPQAPNMRDIIKNMIRALNGGDVTKTNQIYEINTWEALAELDAKALENQEMERRMSKFK